MHKLGQPLKSSALIEFHRDRRRRVCEAFLAIVWANINRLEESPTRREEKEGARMESSKVKCLRHPRDRQSRWTVCAFQWIYERAAAPCYGAVVY